MKYADKRRLSSQQVQPVCTVQRGLFQRRTCGASGLFLVEDCYLDTIEGYSRVTMLTTMGPGHVSP